MNTIKLNTIGTPCKAGGGGGTPINNQEKSVDITENGTIEVFADAGFTGLGKITINVNVPTGTPTYENGVYIQHIDGKLYTEEEWTANGFANDLANGVAVVDEDVKLVLATVFVGSSFWAESVIDTLQVPTDAVDDINGYANTQIILATGQNSAAKLAASYIFPNGNQGYLPSAGEFNRITKFNSNIQSALQCLGKQNLSGKIWSSTRFANNTAVRYTIGSSLSSVPISAFYNIWAATSL